MSDAQLRELERKWQEGGALADWIAYLSGLRRSGAAVEGIRDFLQAFYDGFSSGPRLRGDRISSAPPAMEGAPGDSWKILPSTLRDADVADLEAELGVTLPPLFRAYLQASFHLFWAFSLRYDESFQLPVMASDRPLEPLRDLLRTFSPSSKLGLIPFARWGLGLLCFDTTQNRQDDPPVVWVSAVIMPKEDTTGMKREPGPTYAELAPQLEVRYASFAELLFDVFGDSPAHERRFQRMSFTGVRWGRCQLAGEAEASRLYSDPLSAWDHGREEVVSVNRWEAPPTVAAVREWVERANAARAPGLVRMEVCDAGDAALLIRQHAEGECLRDWARDAPLAASLNRVAEAAQTLSALHRASLVCGRLCVADWRVEPDRHLWLVNPLPTWPDNPGTEPLGNLLDFSRELILGEPLTPAADVWFLGVLLHWALAAEHPFAGESAIRTMQRIVSEVPRSLPPEVSTSLAEVAQTALEKDPAARYRNAGEFATALEAVVPVA